MAQGVSGARLSQLMAFFDRNKTFRPKKHFQSGTLKHQLHKQAEASLFAGLDLKQLVKAPEDQKMEEWLAVHVLEFFNRLSLVYGIIEDCCTAESCPKMSGGSKFEYLWQDNKEYKKPTSLPAPIYIGNLMDWAQDQINDESIFPVQGPYGKNYLHTVKKLFTRFYRIFVHIYIHHFSVLREMGAEGHVNTCYKHFYYFVTEYNLIAKKEFEPLRQMTERLCPESVTK